ncbi:MAG: hypothetical protein AAGJ11_07960 [Bacteroidota bacterium]
MIFRRVLKHVQEQNWTAIGIDLVIVVLGVFIGLQVSNWNTARQDRSSARALLVRLENDLASEIKTWRHGVDYYGVARAHGVAALEGYTEPSSPSPTAFLVNLYQASQRWEITSQRGTYDELISSGRIALIRDEATRVRLANHYLLVAALQATLDPSGGEFQYRREVRLYMPHDLQDAIRGACGDEYVVEGTNTFYLRLPESCPLTLPEDAARKAADELLANEAVRRELRFHVSVLDGQLATMENAAQIAEATLAQVRSALETQRTP